MNASAIRRTWVALLAFSIVRFLMDIYSISMGTFDTKHDIPLILPVFVGIIALIFWACERSYPQLSPKKQDAFLQVVDDVPCLNPNNPTQCSSTE